MATRSHVGIRILFWIAQYLIELDEEQAKNLKALATEFNVSRWDR